MKRLALGLVLAFGGCRSAADFDAGRAFPCTFDGGASEQCLEGWLCGVDGRCFNPTEPAQRGCVRGSTLPGAACVAGWVCGVDGQCFDPSLPVPRGCVRDAGAESLCPTAWVCGVDDQCFDPSRGAPRACVRDGGPEVSCPGGWRCSIEQVCFDPNELGRPRDCALDDQCAAAWRCNDTTQKCQPRGVPGPYRCATDLDCECSAVSATCAVPWRCDAVGQQCLPVTDTVAPRVVASWGSRTVSPLEQREAPLAIASGPAFELRGALRLEMTPVATLYPGFVRAHFFSQGGQGFFDGGPISVPRLFIGEVPVRDVTTIALHRQWLYTLARDGGTRRYEFFAAPDAGGLNAGVADWVDRGALFNQPQTALFQCDDLDDAGVTTSNAVLAVIGVNGAAVSLYPQPIGGPANVTASGSAIACGRGVLSVGPGGALYASDLRHSAANLDAGATWSERFATAQRILQFEEVLPPPGSAAADTRLFFVVQTVSDAGVGAVWARFRGSTDFALETVAGSSRKQLGWLKTVCPGGDAPLQFIGYSISNEGPQFGVRCPAASVTGGSVPAAEWLVASAGDPNNGGVRFTAVVGGQQPYQFGTVMQTSSAARQPHAGRDGRFWVDDSRLAEGATTASMLRPAVLDRLPTVLLDVVSNGVPTQYAVADDFTYEFDKRLGLVSQLDRLTTEGLAPVGSVQGDLPWILASNGVLDVRDNQLSPEGMPRLAANMPPGATLSSPASGRVVATDAGTLIFVAGGDMLFGTDVSELVVSTFAQPVQLAALISPSPGLRIQSFAVAPAAKGALIGFVTAAGAFLATPLSARQWQLSAVDVSGLQGAPVRIINVNNQLRMVMSDGRVYTFPGRVPLSQPLLDGGVFRDVSLFCGDTLALTTTGLWALEPAAAGLAQWVPAPIDAGLPVEESAKAQFIESASSVFIANDFGRVVALQPPAGGCP